MKIKIQIIIIAILLIGILALILNLSSLEKITGKIVSNPNSKDSSNSQITGTVSNQDNSIEFLFTDSNNSLNGNIYLNEINIGETTNNRLDLNIETINNLPEGKSELCLLGTTDKFSEDKNWIINPCWEINKEELLSSYKDGYKIFPFDADINMRQPTGREMQNFVRPEDVKNLSEESVSNIMNQIIYESDWENFNSSDYWQFPLETIKSKKGDCEDYSIALVSLLRAQGKQCYAVAYSEHLGVFCYYPESKSFSFLDNKMNITKKFSDDKTQILQDREVEFREAMNEYFNYYGLSTNNRNVNSAFNEQEYIEFKNNEEFVNWVVRNLAGF